MKARVLILILAIAGTVNWQAVAQTNDTYPVLRTLDGETYTRVEVSKVTAAYLIVFFEGGAARIDLTNLPPGIQKKYHFDSVMAAAANEAEAKKHAAAQALAKAEQEEFVRSQAPIGDTVKVRILETLDAPNDYRVSANGVEQTITILPKPVSAVNFVIRMGTVSQNLHALNAAQQAQRQYAGQQRAFADAMEHWANDGSLNPSYAPQQLEANLAEQKVKEQQQQISELTAELSKMRQEAVQATTILARPTGRVRGVTRLWQFMGMPTENPGEPRQQNFPSRWRGTAQPN